MPIEKREHARPTLLVESDGQPYEMTRLAAADWIALRRGDLDDGDMVALAIAAIVDSSLPDGTVLDLREGLALMQAWVDAHKEAAVPPA